VTATSEPGKGSVLYGTSPSGPRLDKTPDGPMTAVGHSLQARPRPLVHKCPLCINTDRKFWALDLSRCAKSCHRQPHSITLSAPASSVAGTSTPRALAGLRSTGRFHRSPHQQVGGFLALQDIEAPHTTTASHIDLIERRVGLAVSGLPSCTCGILLHVATPGPPCRGRCRESTSIFVVMVPVRPANKRPTIAGAILRERLWAFYQASKAVGVEQYCGR
jgi:hypothetical protein